MISSYVWNKESISSQSEVFESFVWDGKEYIHNKLTESQLSSGNGPSLITMKHKNKKVLLITYAFNSLFYTKHLFMCYSSSSVIIAL